MSVHIGFIAIESSCKSTIIGSIRTIYRICTVVPIELATAMVYVITNIMQVIEESKCCKLVAGVINSNIATITLLTTILMAIMIVGTTNILTDGNRNHRVLVNMILALCNAVAKTICFCEERRGFVNLLHVATSK